MEVLELIKRCLRIVHISRKPTREEYEKVAKVTALGMIVIGIIGILSSLIFSLI